MVRRTLEGGEAPPWGWFIGPLEVPWRTPKGAAMDPQGWSAAPCGVVWRSLEGGRRDPGRWLVGPCEGVSRCLWGGRSEPLRWQQGPGRLRRGWLGGAATRPEGCRNAALCRCSRITSAEDQELRKAPADSGMPADWLLEESAGLLNLLEVTLRPTI